MAYVCCLFKYIRKFSHLKFSYQFFQFLNFQLIFIKKRKLFGLLKLSPIQETAGNRSGDLRLKGLNFGNALLAAEFIFVRYFKW